MRPIVVVGIANTEKHLDSAGERATLSPGSRRQLCHRAHVRHVRHVHAHVRVASVREARGGAKDAIRRPLSRTIYLITSFLGYPRAQQ